MNRGSSLVALAGVLLVTLTGPATAQQYADFTVSRWLDGANDVEWSPDGSQIAYTAKAQVNGKSYDHVFRARADGSRPVDLTPDATYNSGTPVWSADGGRIAYVSDQGQFVDFGGAGGGPGVDIWAMAPDGSQKTQLTVAPQGGTNFRPRWSHSGHELFWTEAWNQNDRWRWVMKVANYVDGSSGGHLGPATELNPDPTDLAFYESADFTRDDSGVYYTGTTSNSGNYELYRYDFATQAITRLTDDPELDESAHVSPDGSRLAFISSRDDHSTWSYYEDASWDTNAPPVLDNWAIITANLLIAWLQPVNPQGTDIYLMHPNGTGVMRLTRFSDQQVGGGVPNWAPDGCHVATTAFLTPNASDHPRITDITHKQSVTYLITFPPCPPL